MVREVRLGKNGDRIAGGGRVKRCRRFSGDRRYGEKAAARCLRALVFIGSAALGVAGMMIVRRAVFMNMRACCGMLMLMLMRRRACFSKTVDRVLCMNEGERRMRRENAKRVERDKECREASTEFSSSHTHVFHSLRQEQRCL
jgi:hypothetical protein